MLCQFWVKAALKWNMLNNNYLISARSSVQTFCRENIVVYSITLLLTAKVWKNKKQKDNPLLSKELLYMRSSGFTALLKGTSVQYELSGEIAAHAVFLFRGNSNKNLFFAFQWISVLQGSARLHKDIFKNHVGLSPAVSLLKSVGPIFIGSECFTSHTDFCFGIPAGTFQQNKETHKLIS